MKDIIQYREDHYTIYTETLTRFERYAKNGTMKLKIGQTH